MTQEEYNKLVIEKESVSKIISEYNHLTRQLKDTLSDINRIESCGVNTIKRVELTLLKELDDNPKHLSIYDKDIIYDLNQWLVRRLNQKIESIKKEIKEL